MGEGGYSDGKATAHVSDSRSRTRSWKEVVVRQRRRRDLLREARLYRSPMDRNEEIPRKTKSGDLQR